MWNASGVVTAPSPLPGSGSIPPPSATSIASFDESADRCSADEPAPTSGQHVRAVEKGGGPGSVRSLEVGAVAGHCGCHSDATSFPQCVWLPRLLGIALTTRDHDAHHTRPKACNFAKRFTLWDRAFGTLAPR